MWFKPLILCFVPQSHVRTSVPITKRIAVATEPPPFRNHLTEASFKELPKPEPKSPWEGISVVESKGNYLDEAFLEKGPLYAHQQELPSLPVPSIKETISRFLPTALPLAESPQEAESLERACEIFDEQAQTLQDRLQERFELCKKRNTSWLQEFWQDEAYLKGRDPLNFYSSYYFLLHDPDSTPPPLWESTSCAGTVKAAALIRAAIDYADKVTQGEKEPDVIGKKNKIQFLCSTGYKYLFNACRIPKLGTDTYRVYNPNRYRHAIVALHGRFYEIPLQDEKGKLYSRAVLEDLISQVIEKGDKASLELGLLTTWNRDDWARARALLLQRGGPKMSKALERMESALLVVNLDLDTRADTFHNQANAYWHGGETNAANRWWDKSIQLAVTKNGSWGYLGEHSMADGLLPVGFCEHLLQKGADRLEDASQQSHFPNPEPKAIDVFKEAFADLTAEDSAAIQEVIAKAKADFAKEKDKFEMEVEHYEGYGTDFIKRTGVSSDAYAQMAMQLAAYRLFGKPVGTYESTQVRPFLHGRTETTRAVSPSSVQFCKAMGLDPLWNRSPEERHEKLKLLQDAAFHHVWYSKKATMGQGIDRHFFGLSKMLQDGEEPPDLFKHPLFLRSKHWNLSTSTLPTCPGFGPVVDDGLGIGYAVYENEMIFNIAGLKATGYAEKFALLLEQTLDEMMLLLAEGDGNTLF